MWGWSIWTRSVCTSGAGGDGSDVTGTTVVPAACTKGRSRVQPMAVA